MPGRATPPGGGAVPAAGRRMAAALGECGMPAQAYGACVSALGKKVELGACNSEFESLRKCFLAARKRAGK